MEIQDEKRPGSGTGTGSSSIVELPSFTSDETSRPTVLMPPLADRSAIDDERSPGDSHRERSSTLIGVVPSPVPPRVPSSAPLPIASEETLPIGALTRAPAPPS